MDTAKKYQLNLTHKDKIILQVD